jgi:hypothetical protein
MYLSQLEVCAWLLRLRNAINDSEIGTIIVMQVLLVAARTCSRLSRLPCCGTIRVTSRASNAPLSTYAEFQRDASDLGRLQDFVFVPDFLDVMEQKTLLTASLKLLDSSESGQHRRLRRKLEASRQVSGATTPTLQSLFLPDELYHFEEVCLHSFNFSFFQSSSPFP